MKLNSRHSGGAKPETVDLTDEDVKIIERVQKSLRISRRMAWFFLALFVAQFSLLIWLASFVTRIIHESPGIGSPFDIGIGLCFGFVFGSMMAALAFTAVKHFGVFVDGRDVGQ